MKQIQIKKTTGALLVLFLILQIFSIPMGVSATTAVQKVVLDKHSLSFSVGESVKLVAQVTPGDAENKEIHFVATDDSIILSEPSFHSDTGKTTVSVSAVKNASGSVIAFSTDGYATDTCSVTVGNVLEESQMINRAVGGTVSVSNSNSNTGEDVTKLFDNSSSTKWLVLNTASASVTYQFADSKQYFVTQYALVSANDDPVRDPKSWVLYGSNNGTDWDKLDERSNEVFYGRKLKRIFSFTPASAYAYYKLDITGNNGGTHTQLSEIQLFECGDYPSWGMGPFEKIDESNPILEANNDTFYCPVNKQNIKWTDLSLYNPTAIIKDGVINLLYRAQTGRTSRIGLATSTDGLTFSRRTTPVIYPDNDEYLQYENVGGCEDPRVVEGPDGKYYIYYTGYDGNVARLMVASSSDLISWQKHGLVFADAYNGKYRNTWSKSGSVITEIVDGKQVAKKFDGKFWMYWGESDFFMASSDDLIHWTPLEDASGKLVSVMKPRKGMYDSYLVEPGPAAIYTDDGIFMLYNCANDNPNSIGDPMLANRAYCPGQVMFDKDDPTKIIHRTSSYFMYPEKDYELDGLVNNVCFVEGMVYYKNLWYIYYGTADSRLAVATWDPAASVQPNNKEVLMESDALTLRAGKSSALSATLKTGVTSDKPLKFVSTNKDIKITGTTFDAAAGKTTVALSADTEGSGIIIAVNENSFASSVCSVTVTKAYYAGEPEFLSGGKVITSVTAGDISMQMDITGYYDMTASFRPVIAAYEDGKLIDWKVGSSLAELKEGVTETVETPAVTIPTGDDMTRYAVKGFLWDEGRMPLCTAIVLDTWSPPNLALGKTVTASSQEKDEVSAQKAVDGNLETRWASGSQDNQWLMVDLGAVTDVNQVVIRWESAYSNKYRIEVSASGTSNSDFTSVAAVTNGTGGNATHSFNTVQARYIRLYCETRATTWGNSVWEFEVYNQNQKTELPTSVAAGSFATLTDQEITIAADKDRKTADVTLNLPVEKGEEASVICLVPDYIKDSTKKDASDYLQFKDTVCYLDQLTFAQDGEMSFTVKPNEVDSGSYLLAVTTGNKTYLYTFTFDVGEIILGDMDNDGTVNVTDVVKMRSVIMKGNAGEELIAVGDFDNDNKLTVTDVVALRAYIMKGK